MDGNVSQGDLLSHGSTPYGGIDFQGQMAIRQLGKQPDTMDQHLSRVRQDFSLYQSVPGSFLLPMGSGPQRDQSISMAEFGRGASNKNSASEDDEPSFTEEGVDGNSDVKKGIPWQRVKWTDMMVKLLITAVSYMTEDAASDFSSRGRRKCAVLQKKGKWKSISRVMAERGCHVSPQQCEDKFNDLNKRYKKLNEMLGRGTSCKVVENPGLLEVINYLSDKEKDDVRKILISKQLFYEEMCSYHNRNRLNLPHDPALQRSLLSALRSGDDHDIEDVRRNQSDDLDEHVQDVEADDWADYEEKNAPLVDDREMHGSVMKGSQCQVQEGVFYGTPLSSQEYSNISNPHTQIAQADTREVVLERMRVVSLNKHLMDSRLSYLEEQKLQIQIELLEIERQKFQWEKFSEKRDKELEKMRMENERMKLENEQMALELKQKEFEAGFN